MNSKIFLVSMFVVQITGNILLGALAHADEIKMITASSVYSELLVKIIPEFEKTTKHKIVFVNDSNQKTIGGPVSMDLLLSGAADASVAAIGFEGWVKSYKDVKKEAAKSTDKLTQRVIGRERMRIIAHQGVGVTKLTLGQAEGMFTGAIKNWKDVGGKNVPVTVAVQTSAVSRTSVFKQKVMKDKEFVPGFKAISDSNDLKKLVSGSPGAVSFYPESQIEEGDRFIAIETDEDIGRPITLITVGKPSEPVLKFISFIEAEGSRILKSKK